MAKDVIEDLVARLLAAAPDLPVERVTAIAVEIRRDWGGGKHYVKKAPTLGKAFGLGTALAAGVPLSQAFAEVGVSARHGLRLAARRWRDRRGHRRR